MIDGNNLVKAWNINNIIGERIRTNLINVIEKKKKIVNK